MDSTTDPVNVVTTEVAAAMEDVPGPAIAEFAQRLDAAGHLVIIGAGRSGLMAKAFAMRLMQLGLSVHVSGETTTPAIVAEDHVVAVSGSGTTPTTVHLVESARKTGARALAVTADGESRLAELSEFALVLPGATKYRRSDERSTQQPLSSLFDQVTHLALDAVCLRLAQLRGVDNAEARSAHATE